MTQRLSLEQIRLVDQVAINRFGISGLVLMENAGRGAADIIASHFNMNEKCVVLCGIGNNGGDGMVVARHLHASGIDVLVVVAGPRSKLAPDCATNLNILEKTRVPICWLDSDLVGNDGCSPTEERFRQFVAGADCIVDALLGTGSKGDPRGVVAALIQAANESKAKKFAIDLPSGMDAKTGSLGEPTFEADITLTFVAEKPSFRNPDSAAVLGVVRVLPIGIPPEVIESVIADTH